MSQPALVDESERLHARVRAFALASEPEETFDEIALAIAEFQCARCPGFRRLVERHGGALRAVEKIPAVPSEAFRLTRVAVHEPSLDVARFETSGTSGEATGRHPMRTLETYRELSLLHGARALAPRPMHVVALTTSSPSSSLARMVRFFIERFGSVEISGRDADERYLLTENSVDVDRLRRAASVAAQRGEGLLVAATAFALVALLDALGTSRIDAPAGSVVMPTGGFKGRTREVDAVELRDGVARAFGIPTTSVVGEYGMTELTSQLYEGTLEGGEFVGPPDVYLPPRWLRVTPVDPSSLEAVPEGDAGLARFVDLGNVDSAVAVVTQDLVRRQGEGIELLGRRPGAPARGCSLAVEEMVRAR